MPFSRGGNKPVCSRHCCCQLTAAFRPQRMFCDGAIRSIKYYQRISIPGIFSICMVEMQNRQLGNGEVIWRSQQHIQRAEAVIIIVVYSCAVQTVSISAYSSNLLAGNAVISIE